MTSKSTRRDFLKTTAGISAGLWVTGINESLAAKSPNEKLNIGAIGVGGRGRGDVAGVSSENIVAICDVNETQLNASGKIYTQAKKYFDYRKLLDQKDLDAVVIGTPDHHHAPAAIRAMHRGCHVYCEKPLTHTVREARILAETAKEKGLATQMGTQNHEHPGYLKVVEMIQSGMIGSVSEVHVITDRPGRFWDQGLTIPKEEEVIPSDLKWDLWLGPAKERDYHSAYVPRKWRGWWDFGCGAIGDMAIHLMDPAFWALKLGGPVKVTSTGPAVLPDCGPTEMVSTFEFEKRGDLAPCKVFWYEGLAKPPKEIADILPMNGSLFIGNDGKIAVPHAAAPTLIKNGESVKQTIEENFDGTHHHKQWIQACKTGSQTGSHFGYAGPFTETVLLGNIAYRVGKTIHYDPKSMTFTNAPEANHYLTKEYRKGWEV